MYSESGDPSCADAKNAAYGPQSDPSAEENSLSAKNKAACRDASAASSRPKSAMVCGNDKMARPVSCRARPLIILSPFPHLRARSLDPHYNKLRPQ